MIGRLKKTAMAAIGLAAFAAAGTATLAQESTNERRSGATIYHNRGYNGSAVYIGGARSNLNLPWRVRSIRVHSGSWEFCERPNYGGTCRTFSADTPVVGNVFRGMTVQSVRPAGGGFIGVEADNEVLRGRYSEFHTQPEARGYRIPACPSGQPTSTCTRQTADAYCRSRGWDVSTSSESETVNRRGFLADVLCSNNRG